MFPELGLDQVLAVLGLYEAQPERRPSHEVEGFGGRGRTDEPRVALPLPPRRISQKGDLNLETPIRPAGKLIPPDTQTPTLREIERLERRLGWLKAQVEVIQPIHSSVELQYNRIMGDISLCESQLNRLRQGQLVFDCEAP